MDSEQAETVIIRAAQAEDAAVIHAMILALAHDISSDIDPVIRVESTADDFLRLGFGDPAHFHALIAECGEEAVGLCLYFYSFSSWLGRRGVYVQDVYVAPSERGTGLGRKLMAETARVAAEQGATYLRLSVDRSNESAQAFYNGIGLHPARNELIFKVTGKDFQSLINKGGLRL